MQQLLDNQIEVDRHNSRIIGYICHADQTVLAKLAQLQESNSTTKTIIYTTEAHAPLFEQNGYHQEGVIEKFFLGRDAVICSRFYSESRSISTEPEKKEEIVQIVLADRKTPAELPQQPHYPLKVADTGDTAQLADLYRRVFAYYPTNVFDPQYLAEQMGENYFFIVAKDGPDIISAASAVIKPEFNCAEITDCATLPEYRGQQLTYSIIRELEHHLKRRQIRCLFSLTRAISIGMNMTVHRLGYTYRGRMVNNCMIYSGLEDMNIWTKYVSG